MDMNDKIARTAGLLYLLVIVTGIFAELYVPSQIIVRGDALATANNILASESLFRLGIAIGLVASIAFLVLPFVLYRLLRDVDGNLAVLMVVLAVASVPLSFVSKAHDLDALTLLSGADYLRAFTTEQLHAQVMLALKAVLQQGAGLRNSLGAVVVALRLSGLQVGLPAEDPRHPADDRLLRLSGRCHSDAFCSLLAMRKPPSRTSSSFHPPSVRSESACGC